MATKKATASKKAATSKKVTPAKKKIVSKKIDLLPAPVKYRKRTLYMHYSAFHSFNTVEPHGYNDFYQEGRSAANGSLIAPILLPVDNAIKSITIYYKNNTQDDLTVLVLKHHVQHIAYSGEIEVALIGCPPGTSSPDNFLSETVTLTANGKILDKYMYHIEVSNTVKNETEERVLLGVKIIYSEPA